MNIELSEFMNILPPWEIADIGCRLQVLSGNLRPHYTDSAWWLRQHVVVAADATKLWTGQSSVDRERVLSMPDTVWLDGEGEGLGDAWCQTPVAFLIGRRHILRDGHHRLVKALINQQPVRYVLIR